MRPLPKLNWTPLVLVTILSSALAAIGGVALLVNIIERQQESRNPFYRVVEISDHEQDPAVWGRNFPLQYDAYQRTVDHVRTRFGGSEAVPRTPSDADPRSVVAQSRLEEDPRLKRFWAGYAFSIDFREDRGHAHMLSDQVYTARQQAAPQPGTCLHCHASVYVPYLRLGDGDLFRGFERMNQMPYAEAVEHVEHPVACIDCHDPRTMALRVTRPAFVEGIAALKRSEGIDDYDVARDASRQELRSFVCGQCHVEYYFQGDEKRLVYPWSRGLNADAALAVYDDVGFSDWTHAETGAPMLKAQHPEFEMWNQGIHAHSGVTCVDCHMPYRRHGALKISDHQVRSPLLDITTSCQTCHRRSEDELRARVEAIQTRTLELRNRGMDAVVALIDDLASAQARGTDTAALETPRQFHRRAQFLLDYVEAENSLGFHAPQESARLLAIAIDWARQGQLSLRDASGAGTP